MASFHISPATGEVRPCKATVRGCPVGGDHFDNREDANSHLEQQLGNEYGATSTMTKPSVAVDPKVRREQLRNESKEALQTTPGLWRAGTQVVSSNKIGVKFKNGFVADYNRGQTNEDLAVGLDAARVLKKLNATGGITSDKDKKALNEVLKKNLYLDDKKAEMLTDIVSSPKDTKVKKAILEKLADDTNDTLNGLDNGATKAWKRYEVGDWQTPLRNNTLSHYLGDEAEAISQAASADNVDTVVSFNSIKEKFSAVKGIFKGKRN